MSSLEPDEEESSLAFVIFIHVLHNICTYLTKYDVTYDQQLQEKNWGSQQLDRRWEN